MKRARIDVVPGLKRQVAEYFAEGLTQQEIADQVGVSDRGTVAAWLKRSDVQALISEIVRERTNRIVRHVDTALEKKLEQKGDTISIDTLLKIRAGLAGATVNMNVGTDKAKAMQEMITKLNDDPDLAAAFAAELDGSE